MIKDDCYWASCSWTMQDINEWIDQDLPKWDKLFADMSNKSNREHANDMYKLNLEMLISKYMVPHV